MILQCCWCSANFGTELIYTKYCSRNCYKKAKEFRRSGRRKQIKIETICKECTIVFQSSYRKNTYCSNRCQGINSARNNPQFKKKFLDIPDCLENASRKLDKTLGYVRVYAPMHPEANGWGYVYEHRVIAEQMIGRRLIKREVVHHKNGKRWDNRVENLEVMNKLDHDSLHGQREWDKNI